MTSPGDDRRIAGIERTRGANDDLSRAVVDRRKRTVDARDGAGDPHQLSDEPRQRIDRGVNGAKRGSRRSRGTG